MTTTGTAVVTGAGSGIGRVIARKLLEAGWRVAAAGRREQLLQDTITPGDWSPAAGLAVPADVSVPASVADLFARVQDHWQRLDLLVNNAGVFGPAGAVDELEPAQWQGIVDVNLTGSFLCAHHAVKIMKAQQPRGGRIINNGSISAHSPRPGSVGYTATKHAITGLTKSISLDGRPFEIACGQIDIGNAATPLTDRMVQGDGVLQPDGRKMIEPRMAAEDVGRAVVYMASLPLDTNVLFMTVMANLMPFVGRG